MDKKSRSGQGFYGLLEQAGIMLRRGPDILHPLAILPVGKDWQGAPERTLVLAAREKPAATVDCAALAGSMAMALGPASLEGMRGPDGSVR